MYRIVQINFNIRFCNFLSFTPTFPAVVMAAAAAHAPTVPCGDLLTTLHSPASCGGLAGCLEVRKERKRNDN